MRARGRTVGGSGSRIRIAFDPDILRNGTNPLVLLDDLRALGACEIVANLDDGRVHLEVEGRPEEVAAAVRFLASDEAGYITGHVLNVNGGMYM